MYSTAGLALVIALATIPRILVAQSTGQFNPGSGVRKLGDDASRDRTARLFVDPSISSPLRSSAWAFSLQSSSEKTEVKIQANLSDLKPEWKSALSFSLVGPVSENSALTDVANLDGLAGKTRAELAFSSDVARETTTKTYGSLTFSSPLFEYRNNADVTRKEETRKALYAVKGGIVYSKAKYWTVSVGGRFEKSFVDQKKQTVCAPLSSGTPGALTCESLVVGAPSAAEKQASEVGVRRALSNYAAVSFNWIHDFKNSVDGFEIPIWVIPDAGGTLGGGLRITYVSERDKNLRISLFVGTFKL